LSQIILASGSPRRKKLLQQIKLPFEVEVSSVDEDYNPSLSPKEIVIRLALRKARDVGRLHEEALIIGADTIVVFGNSILEKPANRLEAIDMLTALSGKKHEVFTGVALLQIDKANNIDREYTFVERTDVYFGDLNPNDIRAYVKGGSPMDKAGGYGIQDDFGAIFVSKIEGDYNNVVGFPLHRFYTVLQTFAPDYLPQHS